MLKSHIAPIIGAFVICVAAVPAQATTDASAEVAATLYDASATQAALAKTYDTNLRARQAQIVTLRKQLSAERAKRSELSDNGRARLTELTAAEESLVAQLAERDRAYAQSIAIFRRGVTDIASTPEGLKALARFNSGDEAGALAILDKLAASNDAARAKRDAIESAVEKRRIAMLAFEAQWRGKLSTADVIARFEAVVALDSNVSTDWSVLGSLYAQANRLPDGLHAAREAQRLAQDDSERLMALDLLANSLLLHGDIAEEGKVLDEAVAIARRRAGANPADVQAQVGLAISLGNLGSYMREQGHAADAGLKIGEALQIAGSLLQAHPKYDLFSQLSELGLAGGELYRTLGHYAEARNIYELFLTAHRALITTDPSNGIAVLQFERTLLDSSRTVKLQGDLAAAKSVAEEALSIARRQLQTEPGNMLKQLIVTQALEILSDIELSRGKLTDARKDADEAVAIFGPTAKSNSGNLMVQAQMADLEYYRGRVMLAQGDIADALDDFRRAAATMQQLIESGPGTGDFVSEFIQILTDFAKATAAKGDLVGARTSYQQALKVAQKLIAVDPANIEWQRNQWIALDGLARLTDSGVTWKQVIALMEPFEAKGMLSAEDRTMLDASRKQEEVRP
ncbi:hypothetical protein GCM10009087_40400 [Sphingomonas oligophenolica]|uniref:Tetratricopeptide repeat protein n=1 Tax=Sphingomonas oligophenolica TaxID=301154 RepID=A0ABU9Y265_9SPHN